MLHPFLGFRAREHLGDGNGPCVLTKYDVDQSGTKTYRFNSLGFRGEEFDPAAKKHIYCCGCSYLAGVGLDYEETAVAHFKKAYVADLGLADRDVNVMNFSMGSASNDYIARTLVSQIHAERPDVVFACYTHTNRAEYVNVKDLGASVHSIGPWHATMDAWTDEIAAAQNVGSRDAQAVLTEAALGYYTFYTETIGLLRFVSNALLVQLACERLGIEDVALWVEPKRLAWLQNNFVVSSFARALVLDHFVPPSAFEFPFEPDLAADGHHPGPRVQAHLGAKVFETYRRRYPAK